MLIPSEKEVCPKCKGKKFVFFVHGNSKSKEKRQRPCAECRATGFVLKAGTYWAK